MMRIWQSQQLPTFAFWKQLPIWMRRWYSQKLFYHKVARNHTTRCTTSCKLNLSRTVIWMQGGTCIFCLLMYDYRGCQRKTTRVSFFPLEWPWGTVLCKENDPRVVFVLWIISPDTHAPVNIWIHKKKWHACRFSYRRLVPRAILGKNDTRVVFCMWYTPGERNTQKTIRVSLFS